ncbi:monosaccharide-transporting ATPase [Candidatus Vecturithrix granuli]|uniref:Monosaccharide-transporting ATPase n=1 Tax=Vecturithrix granuli TaxID=1499967 RepID=A0A081C8A2_VECG1|nr:monosaccharide-transporting ATPase [Candidatus Vecturithrix granuli]
MNADKFGNQTILQRIFRIQEFGVFLILIGLSALLAIFRPGSFLSVENISYVARAFSFIAIMAFGECMVIITAGIDLSIGSVFGLSAVCSAIVMKYFVDTQLLAADSLLLALLCFVAGMIMGIALGCVNALFITKTKLPPFIATLGMLSIARGLAEAVTVGWPLQVSSAPFRYLGQGFIGFVPVPVIIMVLLAIATTFFLRKTILGRYVFAIGSNEEAARLSGINVDRMKFLVYALSGLFAGIGGMLLVARLGVAQSSAGFGYELDGIAAVVIGGASLMGGEGSILGVVLGAAIMGVIRNGLVLLNVSAYWQKAAIGAVLIAAIVLDQLRKGQIGRKK